MKITRVKALVMGTAALLVLAVAAGLGYVLFADGDELQYKTQRALRSALPEAAADELRARGVTLAAPLKCQDLPGWTKRKLRATCTGTATDKREVRVIGTGEEKTKDNYYTILVGGTPLVENATCLGSACHQKKG